MIPIRKLGFNNVPYISDDMDVANLVTCIKNAWNLESKDIWFRHTKTAFEIAVVLSFTRDRQSFETLIKVDTLLEGFRARDFAIGEIKPAVASFVLISIFK